MPRPTLELTSEMLPKGFENFIPLPERKFPISPKQKDKRDWECSVCGFIDSLSYSDMRARKKTEAPYQHGMGCKACKSAKQAMVLFLQHRAAPWLKITGWAFDHDNSLSKESSRRFESILFFGICNCGHRLKVSRNQLKLAYKHGLSCSECAAQSRSNDGDRLADSIRAYWPEARIVFSGENSQDEPSFIVEIPGSDGTPNVEALGRIRGRFVTSEREKAVSINKLTNMVKRDKADRQKILDFIAIGEQFGSTVEEVGLVLGKKELGVRYRNALGELKPFYSMARAKEYSAGRPVVKQTQTLIQCVLVSAFPGNDWVSDDRSYLSHLQKVSGLERRLSGNAELDIGTQGIVEGGLWVEYQGYQSHCEDKDVMASDRLKVEVCRNRCLLLVIDKIESANAQKAIQAVKHSLENHTDETRAKKALSQWSEPDPKAVAELWMSAKGEKAREIGENLSQVMSAAGHTVLTGILDIFSNGTFAYLCGHCGAVSEGNGVRQYLYSPSMGCKHCEVQRIGEMHCNNRKERWSQHPLWSALSVETQTALCDGSDTFSCPQCEAEAFKTTLERREDYLCLHCLDTGRKITDSGGTAGTIYQHLNEIKMLISSYDEAPAERFEDQIFAHSNKINVSMTVHGDRHCLPLSEWKRQSRKHYSEVFHEQKAQYSVLYKAFPNYQLIESEDSDVVIYETGLGTLCPSGEVIPHPITKFSKRELSVLHNKSGGVKRRSKNHNRENQTVDWDKIRDKLSYMHDLRNGKLSSSWKTLGDFEARYQFRAACVGIGHIPPEYRRQVSVTAENIAPTDSAKSTGEKYLFECADARHRSEIKTADARFSTSHNKPGFCSRCLRAAGKTGMDFRQIEQDAKIVDLAEFDGEAWQSFDKELGQAHCTEREAADGDVLLHNGQLELL